MAYNNLAIGLGIFLATHSVMVKKAQDLGFGAIIPVAPGTWLALKHVIGPYDQHRVEIPSSNIHDYASWDTRATVTPHILSDQDQAYFTNLIRNDREPLYGLANINVEFTEYLDLALLSGPTVDVLYPSTASLSVNDWVASFAFNGLPVVSALINSFDLVYGNSLLKPTVQYANSLFHFIGSKGVSFGNILATGSGILAHSCPLLSGASGGFLKKVTEDGVTFVGIHTGGDFNTGTNVAYNYGYHTSHIGLVLFYAKYLYPIFKAHGAIPDPIIAYLRHHKTTIEQHREFVANDLFTTVLL